MSLKTLKRLRTEVTRFFEALTRTSQDADTNETWVTVSTTNLRWEAELMQQVLMAHDIPTRLVALGLGLYMGQGSPAALQVLIEDEQTALNLLRPVEEKTETSE
ncbi:hypothetical protein H6F86_12600 [Phormidium sp. FACHB-592]|uniref:DUF2007 domain-containing protein n=1 Tax=Stenomitos frigidus AS-A4 TaxID=2933935 RepID=A0ABV0KJJ3_9CYAN|nr:MULTISPECIES: hypothetical protein [Cyanophyceae]MBD2037512.1 hypothetical protein [Leptolyngbya sp. FACHB-321]MBD2074713.1 hypothetical protein [Phormidium sp. FACHB-592]